RVAAVSGGRIVGAVDSIPVTLARPDTRQVTVPDEPVHLPQRHPGLRAVGGEQAQFHPLCHLGEQGEVGPCTVICRPQRVAVARPHLPVPCHRSTLPPKFACIRVMLPDPPPVPCPPPSTDQSSRPATRAAGLG